MSNVNMVSIIRNLPHGQLGIKPFDEVYSKKNGNIPPSFVSALSCPLPFRLSRKPAIELQQLSLGTDNVTRPAVDYFSSKEKGGLDLENAFIDGNNIPFDPRNRSLDIQN